MISWTKIVIVRFQSVFLLKLKFQSFCYTIVHLLTLILILWWWVWNFYFLANQPNVCLFQVCFRFLFIFLLNQKLGFSLFNLLFRWSLGLYGNADIFLNYGNVWLFGRTDFNLDWSLLHKFRLLFDLKCLKYLFLVLLEPKERQSSLMVTLH